MAALIVVGAAAAWPGDGEQRVDAEAGPAGIGTAAAAAAAAAGNGALPAVSDAAAGAARPAPAALPAAAAGQPADSAWSNDEVAALVEGVLKCDAHNWKQVKALHPQQLSRRSTKDLRDRWHSLCAWPHPTAFPAALASDLKPAAWVPRLPRGDEVEVRSVGEGFRGGWFGAKVLQLVRRADGELGVHVQYKDFTKEEGTNEKLEEWVPLCHVTDSYVLPCIRKPYHPAEPHAAFEPGQAVEAFFKEGWYTGKVLAAVGGQLAVCYEPPPLGEGSHDLESPQDLRPAHPQMYQGFGAVQLPVSAGGDAGGGPITPAVAPVGAAGGSHAAGPAVAAAAVEVEGGSARRRLRSERGRQQARTLDAAPAGPPASPAGSLGLGGSLSSRGTERTVSRERRVAGKRELASLLPWGWDHHGELGPEAEELKDCVEKAEKQAFEELEKEEEEQEDEWEDAESHGSGSPPPAKRTRRASQDAADG
ncbi:hypothetical protein C2E20_1601 [Micractinium conductrix]|uniref:Myb-like domain-containing protein n=1 Tax=Micractinium conductrix TaxID=554055 RepID=A0A2P6VMX3_9CHLO|nr:hypothetical protein C2E20_1601 [Micractinium conductrix]|eukprot:PSC75452.1 hypothetical protein C2E20_1601 [Micractinium conductrix]